eukprot:m.146512 g.146512  ORF g.146512 m.146512 type:complete len:576 (-) comp30483_c0_seq1:29-1756(-)
MLQLYPRLVCTSQRATQYMRSSRYAANLTHADHTPFDTGIRIRNSLTKKKEPLCTIKPGVISWYQCGPTVYDTSHIGHACTYVRFDVIRRLLQNHFGIQVIQVQGLTDVDDKIIARAASTSQDPRSLARTFELEYAMQMDSLNVLPPTLQLRVSESTTEIIEFIEGICDRGHAYPTKNGVYFDTFEFGKTHQYGKLHPKRQQQGDGHESSTTDPDQVKKTSADFSLWKSAKPGELCWPSPWGEGRPGWHIECSAMASKVFGKHLDLHTGGQDLAFPHHENEMAQSESFHGCSQWGNVYLHSGHVMLKDLKISKSVGNVISIESILNRCSADDFRLLCLLTKYHKSFNFNDDVLERATKLNRRFEEFLVTSRLACEAKPTSTPTHQQPWGDTEHSLFGQVAHTKTLCDEAFRNDFDTPTALTHMGDLVTATNRYLQDSNVTSVAPVLAARSLLETNLRMLGLTLSVKSNSMENTWTSMVNATSDSIASPAHSRSPGKHDTRKLQSLENAVTELVDFRAMVRQRALETLKSKPKSEELKKLANELMHDCDSVRDKLGNVEPQPIVLRDTKDTSIWRI